MTAQKQAFYSVDQIAGYLGLSSHTVYRMIKEEKLKAVRFTPRLWRIPREALEELTGIEVGAGEIQERFALDKGALAAAGVTPDHAAVIEAFLEMFTEPSVPTAQRIELVTVTELREELKRVFEAEGLPVVGRNTLIRWMEEHGNVRKVYSIAGRAQGVWANLSWRTGYLLETISERYRGPGQAGVFSRFNQAIAVRRKAGERVHEVTAEAGAKQEVERIQDGPSSPVSGVRPSFVGSYRVVPPVQTDSGKEF